MVEGRRKLAAILSADVAGYSRLMGADEEATVAALDDCRAIFKKSIAEHEGRVVDTAGDSVLAEFPSVVEAVRAAVEIQESLAQKNAPLPEDRRMLFRIGVNLGDVIAHDDGTIYGDGVNVAARLESLAKPGAVTVSEDAYRQVDGKIDLGFEDIGEHAVKNIARPVRAYRVRSGREATAPPGGAADMHQEIRFCMAADGVQIAYATAGQGPPLIKAGNWMTHLEYDWDSPIWSHLMWGLARDNRLIRYDARGNGLSDWDVEDISFEAYLRDLETVVDATGVDRFALLGISQGCVISVAYAARHPERVTHLVLYGGFARGTRRRGSQAAKDQADAMRTLIGLNWGKDNPAFRRIFTSLFVPDATPEQMQWFNELQRISTSPEVAVRIRLAVENFDVTDDLAKVSAPTLVLHCRDDGMVPFEEGRRMATMIPDARFVALEGRNHLILENEPAWGRFLEEVRGFLATNR